MEGRGYSGYGDEEEKVVVVVEVVEADLPTDQFSFVLCSCLRGILVNGPYNDDKDETKISSFLKVYSRGTNI